VSFRGNSFLAIEPQALLKIECHRCTFETRKMRDLAHNVDELRRRWENGTPVMVVTSYRKPGEPELMNIARYYAAFDDRERLPRLRDGGTLYTQDYPVGNKRPETIPVKSITASPIDVTTDVLVVRRISP